MKAYQITADYSITSLKLTDVTYPKLLPNQILVKIKAVSFNYRDLLVIKGVDRWKPPIGRVPVSDGVGVVVETGSQVTAVNLHDRVAGLFLPKWIEGKLVTEKLGWSLAGAVKDGLLQEYMIFDEHEVVSVPEYLSDEEAATLPCAGLTAWHGLIEKGNIKSGDTVVVQGTGGISLFSAQFALMAGADVILLSGSDEKLDVARKLGVKQLINYNEVPHWENEVVRLTNGRGADHIVEVVGAGNINKSIEAVAIDGTISVIGLVGGLKGEINTEKIMARQIRLQGIEVGSKEMFKRMNNALAVNKLHPVISLVYSFEDAREALTILEKGAHYGKVCLKMVS